MAGRQSNRQAPGLHARDRAVPPPTLADNMISAGIPPQPLQAPGLDIHKCLVIYNTDVAWSETGADYWAARHGVVSHKLGFPLGANVASTDAAYDGRGDEYASLLAPIYAYVIQHHIEAIFLAPGTPTRCVLAEAPVAGTFIWNLASFLSCVVYITEWRAANGAGPIRAFKSFGTEGRAFWTLGNYNGWQDGQGRCGLLGYVTNEYRPSRAWAGSNLNMPTPRLADTTIPRVIAGTSIDYGSILPPDGLPFLACGRIGRPRFLGDANLPTETLALACAVIDQAVTEERNLEQVRHEGLGLHIGVSTRVAGDMPDYDPATVYDYSKSLGLKASYYTKTLTSPFALKFTPANRETYSLADLLGGGVAGKPCWAALGYAIENEPLTNTALQAAWQVHPGAWCYEGTSYSYLQVGRIQKGGGIGGLAHTNEPYSTDAGGVWLFFYNVLHGMTLAEAHFRGTQQVPWQSCIVGDPLYRPLGGPTP